MESIDMEIAKDQGATDTKLRRAVGVGGGKKKNWKRRKRLLSRLESSRLDFESNRSVVEILAEEDNGSASWGIRGTILAGEAQGNDRLPRRCDLRPARLVFEDEGSEDMGP
jgi:hypothetical protein